MKKHQQVKSKKMKIRDLQKEYRVNFSVSGNMNVSNYLRKEGLPALGKFLDRLESLQT